MPELGTRLMLPIANQILLAPGTALVEAAVEKAAGPQEGADFLALLAQQTQPALAAPGTAPIVPGSVDAASLFGTILPQDGKPLPVAADVPLDQSQDPAAPAPEPAAQPIALPAMNSIPIPPPGLALPETPHPAGAPLADRALPPQPRPGPSLALAQDQPVVAQPVLQAAPPAVASPAAPRYAPPPRLGANLRQTSESPAEVSSQRLALSEALLPLGPTAANVSTPTFAIGSATVQPQPLGGNALPEALQRPQDFAQLIDRLVAAREAVQPQPVTLALAHAEFGKVELRFANDPGGLSVALASADPEFARAVQAAAAPIQAASEAAGAQSRQHGTSDQHRDPQRESASGQPHGQGSERREGRTRPEPASSSDPARHKAAEPDNDIFA
jgi:hypothetical protein